MDDSFAPVWRNIRRTLVIAFLALVLVVSTVWIIAIAWLNPRLTRYVEGDRFRAELEKETAKGLHFPAGHYAPIHRKSFLIAASDRFQTDSGGKALRAIDAHGITARFNPWGVFLRRWQLDDVHIDSGKVEIQTYTPSRSRARPNPGFKSSSRGAFILSKSKRIRPM